VNYITSTALRSDKLIEPDHPRNEALERLKQFRWGRIAARYPFHSRVILLSGSANSDTDLRQAFGLVQSYAFR
jgi:hypothetical protein